MRAAPGATPADPAATPAAVTVLATARTLLGAVVDPELGADIVTLGMVGELRFEAGTLTVPIGLTTAACPLRAQLRDDAVRRLAHLPGVTQVRVEFSELDLPARRHLLAEARRTAQAHHAVPIPPTVRVLAVASGKGGVGKTTTAVNLAVALAQRGHTVGLLDADIAGSSAALQLGIVDRLTATATPAGPRILPARRRYGAGELALVATGLLTEPSAAALGWRGRLLGRAVQHFLEDVQWGQLDYLILDLPPGTSDVAMKVATRLPHADVLVVTTPEPAAAAVAGHAIELARRYHLRVVGVVENMTGLECPHGELVPVFGPPGAGRALAVAGGVPLLAEVPLVAPTATPGPPGPVVLTDPGTPAGRAFTTLATRLVEELSPPVDRSTCTARLVASLERAAASTTTPPSS